MIFIDVTGSTGLGERLDPERLRRLMRTYFEEAREILERHGGTVEKFIGDAVMAVFGVPMVHEDDALRACRAALEIRNNLRDFNEELEREQGFSIEIRTGLNTGQVVAEEAADRDALVIGDAVNVAARLEQSAAPGEILIGSSTYRLVRDFVLAEPVEAMELRGKSALISAYRLLGLVTHAEAIPRRLGSPLVGRERELEMLRQAFERATAERTLQLFTVLGQAGVGKSRLIHEFLSSLGDEHAVLRGRCLPYGDGLTYLPMVSALRGAAGIADGDTADKALEKLSAVVGNDPDGEVICRLVQQLIGLDRTTAPQEDIFWAVRRFLESIASRQPLVVVIDDIHWAEPTLLDLIEHLADWSRDAPILLIANARPDLLDERPSWGGGKMNAASVLLQPLGAPAAGLLIENLVGEGTLPEAAHAEIVSAAEGNPLFVEEMLGMLVDDGVLREVDGRWQVEGEVGKVDLPPTIQALLAARLDRLSSPEREVAQIAAVVGRVFDRATVEALVTDSARADVRRQVMELVRKDLVRPDRSVSPGVESFRFRHALIRDATYESLSKEDRSRLHTGVAHRLGELATEHATDVSELQGYHLEQAHRYRVDLGIGGPATESLARQAADVLGTAGLKAAARSDIPATIGLLTRATALLPSGDPLRIRLLLELAAAVGEADSDRGAAIVREAHQRAEASGDARVIAHVLVMGRLLGLLPHEELGFDDWLVANEAIADRALAVFTAAGDDLGLSRTWRLLGDVYAQRGRIADEEAALETSLAHARQAGHVREQIENIFELSFTLTQGPTTIPDGIRRCLETIDEYPGNLSIEGWMVHALAHLRARLGDLDEALTLARRTRQILLETGQELSHALMCEVEGDVLVLAGRIDEAIDVMRSGYDAAERHGVRNPVIAVFLARYLCAAGRYDEAEPVAEFALTGPPGFAALAKAQLARIRAHSGQLDEAIGLVNEASDWYRRTDWLLSGADASVDRAEVMRVAGRPADERAALKDALALYRRKGNVLQGAAVERRLSERPGNPSVVR